jgi:hypothetical protein
VLSKAFDGIGRDPRSKKMNKLNSQMLPDENRMEDLLAKIQPVPSERFHQKMSQTAWRMEGGKQILSKRFRLQTALAILALAALVALFISPQGRAWAQEVFEFFGRINSSTVELPPSEVKFMQDINDDYDLPLVPAIVPQVPAEMAALPGCGTPQKSQSYNCQIALAESQLGFDLKELPELPEGWKLDLISYIPASKIATISYSFDFSYMSSGRLSLTQGAGDLPTYFQQNPWLVVPADQVEKVKVGTQEGEYVEGSFILPAGSSNLVWDDSDEHKRLAWSDGTRWYFIEVWRNLNLPEKIGREQLIELAESLVESPGKTAEALDPDYLYSVSDAELVSGLDLKAPTLLPMDITFSYAQYSDANQEVRLFYGFNQELVVHQWAGKSLDLSTLPKDYDPNSSYEIVEIHGKRAFYGFVQGPDAHHFLWWEQDGVNFQLYFYEIVGRLDRDKLIDIAESMQDIDDFRTKDSKPYEYVSIYGEALGVDVLEFPESPAGWTYENVWGDPGARCLTLVYKSVTEPGYLVIYQCLTDQRFNLSDIPARYTQPVQIGSSRGIFAAGDFVTDDNGKLNWKPEPPIKQLYWQRDGLWIKMVLFGESAKFHDQEDLISYAELLR